MADTRPLLCGLARQLGLEFLDHVQVLQDDWQVLAGEGLEHGILSRADDVGEELRSSGGR